MGGNLEKMSFIYKDDTAKWFRRRWYGVVSWTSKPSRAYTRRGILRMLNRRVRWTER